MKGLVLLGLEKLVSTIAAEENLKPQRLRLDSTLDLSTRTQAGLVKQENTKVRAREGVQCLKGCDEVNRYLYRISHCYKRSNARSKHL